ncbi:alpha-mannosidase [candidate division KSB1 bacterium]|nr:alpha-mannosidase [candidate division KSB1 bacterium]
MMKSEYIIYAIGNTHLDPVWQWNIQEGYEEVFNTFRSALDRLKEFPEVYFVASSAQFYEWVAEADPDMFAEIAAFVREGRWIPVGGWWVECDINCATGESLVRQGLYAQRFFEKYFGRKARIGFSPDTFGHAWTIPQILKKQGMDSYFYMRPEMHENQTIPAPLFRWEGADGSQVLAVSIIRSYTAKHTEIEERVQEYFEEYSRDLHAVKKIAVFYGVGNHGGSPTIATIKKIKSLQQSSLPGIRFSSLEEYIDDIQEFIPNLPVFANELVHHARGCYSACADVKKWNRQTCSALVQTEKYATIANIQTDFKYLGDDIQSAWKKVLFNQFHDILAGSSIEEAYQDAGREYGYALTIAHDISMKALRSLVSKIWTADAKYPTSIPFVVFNPCSFSVQQYVEFESEIPDPEMVDTEQIIMRYSTHIPFPKTEIVLRNSEGKAIPYQMLPTAASKQENQPSRIRFLFRADVPAFGYHVYRLDSGRKESPPKLDGLTVKENLLENDLVRIEFDKTTGAVISYHDKKLKKEYFKPPGTISVVLEDPDDTWGHKIQAYDKELGIFGNASMKIIEAGPERARIQVKTFWGDSFIVQDYSLYRESPDLECKILINWHEKYRVLKLSFPTVLENGKCTYSIPYGFIERPMSGNEEPGQEWIDVSSTNDKNKFGFALINDSKCGYSVNNGDIRLTVFHSTAWSHHNPEIVTEQDNCRYMEQGIHEFTYLLVPHAGDWRAAAIPQVAEAMLMPPRIVCSGVHPGKFPFQKSFVSTSMKNVSITVIKRAEDRAGIILRCVELYGRAVRGTIEIVPMNRKLTIEINPYEIKTLYIPFNDKDDIEVVNLLEE